ncbi:MAG: aldo/keto reductase [Lentisphaeria bacterium]|nr:aldo/keto reductase [Lentisphaeria bacterium]
MSPVFSHLMLGTVQFGMNYGVANVTGKPSYETVKAILKEAYDSGVTALDTAPEYGDSEEVIGRALKELGLSDRFAVVTKIPTLPEAGDPEEFMKTSLENSLNRLGIPRAAAVLLHTEKDCIYLDVLKTMCARGLTERAGISLNTLKYKDAGSSADCLQIPCSLLDHRFDSCFGKGERLCFIRGAYLQGMLLMPQEKIPFPEIREKRRRLENLGIPMAELALRYLAGKKGPKCILTGVETLEQLRENIRLSQLPPLSAEETAAVEEIVLPPLDEALVSPWMWNRK